MEPDFEPREAARVQAEVWVDNLSLWSPARPDKNTEYNAAWPLERPVHRQLDSSNGAPLMSLALRIAWPNMTIVFCIVGTFAQPDFMPGLHMFRLGLKDKFRSGVGACIFNSPCVAHGSFSFFKTSSLCCAWFSSPKGADGEASADRGVRLDKYGRRWDLHIGLLGVAT